MVKLHENIKEQNKNTVDLGNSIAFAFIQDKIALIIS